MQKLRWTWPLDKMFKKNGASEDKPSAYRRKTTSLTGHVVEPNQSHYCSIPFIFSPLNHVEKLEGKRKIRFWFPNYITNNGAIREMLYPKKCHTHSPKKNHFRLLILLFIILAPTLPSTFYVCFEEGNCRWVVLIIWHTWPWVEGCEASRTVGDECKGDAVAG